MLEYGKHRRRPLVDALPAVLAPYSGDPELVMGAAWRGVLTPRVTPDGAAAAARLVEAIRPGRPSREVVGALTRVALFTGDVDVLAADAICGSARR